MPIEPEDFYRATSEIKDMIRGVHDRLDVQNDRLRKAEITLAETTVGVRNSDSQLRGMIVVGWSAIAGISTLVTALIGWMARHILFGAG